MSKKCEYTLPKNHDSVSIQVAGGLGWIKGRPALFGMGAISDLDNLINTIDHEETPYSSDLLKVLGALKKDRRCENIQFFTEKVSPTDSVSVALLIHPTKKLIGKVNEMTALTDIFVVLFQDNEVTWLDQWSSSEKTISNAS